MKLLLLGLAALLLAVALAWLVGALLPREHRATRSIVLHRPARELFDAARDFSRHPAWRSDVRSVEILPPGGALGRHREISGDGAITYALRESAAPHRLVTEIDDPTLPFGGRWTIEFVQVNEGSTRVRITEEGQVRPALFRFLARFVFGHTRTMENYLRQLAAKFGEESAPLEP